MEAIEQREYHVRYSPQRALRDMIHGFAFQLEGLEHIGVGRDELLQLVDEFMELCLVEFAGELPGRTIVREIEDRTEWVREDAILYG